MKRFFTQISTLTALTLALCSLGSCSSDISVKAKSDSMSEINLNLDIGTTISSTLKTLTGADSLSKLTSANEVKTALEKKKVTEVSVKAEGNTLAASGILTAPEKQSAGFISCTQNQLSIKLSPESILELYSTLPDESKYFLDLFMAPVFTGEELSPEEYSDLIGAFYGTQLSSELEKSTIKLTLSCPDGKRIKKAAVSGKETTAFSRTKAEFSIPVVEFFTLNQEKDFSIWF